MTDQTETYRGYDTRDERKALFVEACRTLPSYLSACRAADVPYGTFRHWRNDDEEFAQAVLDAREEYREQLRENAHVRANDGYRRQVMHMGQPQWWKDPATGQLMLDDDFEPIPVMENVMETQVFLRHLEANLPEYNNRGGGAAVGVTLPGTGGGAPTKVEVQFVSPPDWEEVEWGEDGRAVLQAPTDPLEE